MYWQRVGDLPYKLALQKICRGNATALDSLCEQNIFEVIDGMICIDFLNEQLAEFNNLSIVNSNNARLGWEKRRKDATALPPQSEPNAIREEKIKKEKKKVDEQEPLTLSMPFETLDFINIWEHWKEYKKIEFKFSYKSVQSQQAALNELANMANGQEHLAIAIIKQSMANGWKGFVNLKGYQDGKPKQQAGQFSEAAARERFNKYSQS